MMTSNVFPIGTVICCSDCGVDVLETIVPMRAGDVIDISKVKSTSVKEQIRDGYSCACGSCGQDMYLFTSIREPKA